MIFSHSTYLTQPQRINMRQNFYECNKCGKTFSDHLGLIQHHVTHTVEKPFKCNDCGKIFSYCSGLIQHQGMHTGEKPYKFNECGHAFSDCSVYST